MRLYRIRRTCRTRRTRRAHRTHRTQRTPRTPICFLELFFAIFFVFLYLSSFCFCFFNTKAEYRPGRHPPPRAAAHLAGIRDCDYTPKALGGPGWLCIHAAGNAIRICRPNLTIWIRIPSSSPSWGPCPGWRSPHRGPLEEPGPGGKAPGAAV